MSQSLAAGESAGSLLVAGEEQAATPWLKITALAMFTRLLALGWMLVAQIVVPAADNYKVGYRPNPHPLMKWDGSWYLDILQSGYSYQPTSQSSVAFFPAYPLLSAAVEQLGISPQLALLITSNLCWLAACFAIWRLVADLHGRRAADLSLLLFLCNPVVVFFMAAYTESTFVLFCTLSLLFLRRFWPLALVAGMVTGATRSTGVLLSGAMVLEAALLVRERRYSLKQIYGLVLASGGPLIGLGAWCLYLQIRFGDPIAFAHVQQMWRRGFAPFWQVYGYWLPYGDFYDWLFLLSALSCMLFVGLGFWLKLRPSLTLFSLLSMSLFMQSGRADSTTRFVFGTFSIYPAIALIAIRWPAVKPYLLIIFIQLALVSIALFTRGYWFI